MTWLIAARLESNYIHVATGFITGAQDNSSGDKQHSKKKITY